MMTETMKTNRVAFGAAVLCVVAASVGVRGESVKLKRKFVPGTRSYMESTVQINQNITGTPMGDMKIDRTLTYGLWEDVQPTSDGNTKVVLTYDRAAMNMANPMMGTMVFDSDQADDEEASAMLGQFLKPLIGTAMTVVYDQGNTVASFSGMDAIRAKIDKGASRNMFWAQMKGGFTSEQARKQWAENPLLIFPNKSVHVGDKWKASSKEEDPQLGTIVTKYQYQLDRIGVQDGRKSAVISFTGTVALTAGPKEQGKDEPQPEFSGSVSGTATYDIKLGRIVKQMEDGALKIKIPAPGSSEETPPKFMNIDMTLHNTKSVLTPAQRNKQKQQAREKAAAKHKTDAKEKSDKKADGKP